MCFIIKHLIWEFHSSDVILTKIYIKIGIIYIWQHTVWMKKGEGLVKHITITTYKVLLISHITIWNKNNTVFTLIGTNRVSLFCWAQFHLFQTSTSFRLVCILSVGLFYRWGKQFTVPRSLVDWRPLHVHALPAHIQHIADSFPPYCSQASEAGLCLLLWQMQPVLQDKVEFINSQQSVPQVSSFSRTDWAWWKQPLNEHYLFYKSVYFHL